MKQFFPSLLIRTRYMMHITSSLIGKAIFRDPYVIILSYHSFSDDNWKYSVSVENFKKQIDYMLKHYQYVSLEEVTAITKGKRPMNKNLFTITIDDGYKDSLSIISYCISKNIAPTIFVLAHSSRANREELKTTRELLSQEDIKKLASNGWEIGSHGATHANFHLLTNPQMEEEIVKSKSRLETILNIPISYFAYPKGVYSNTVVDAVRRAGYKAAVSMDDGIISHATNPLLLYRVGINNTHSLQEFIFLTQPGSIYIRRLLKSYLFKVLFLKLFKLL